MDDETVTRAVDVAICAGTTLFLAIVVWLHVARPDVDPMIHGVSRYAAGPNGFALTTAFSALAVATMASAWSLRQNRDGGLRVSESALWTAAASLTVVVLLPLRPDSPGRTEYAAHQVAGALFFIGATIGGRGIASSLSSSHVRVAARVASSLTTVFLIAFFACVVVSPIIGGLPVGLLQRCLFAGLCACFLLQGLGAVSSRQSPA